MSHQEWENIECKTDNHVPLFVPSVQATDHQTRALGDRKQTQAVGDHELKVETGLPEWLQPFTEAGYRGVRQMSLQLMWKYTASTSYFRASSSETYSEKSREKAQFIHSFSDRPELRSLQTYESYESAMQKTS